MKDYLNFEALSYFLSKLLDKFVLKDEEITNAEIDEICGAEIIAEEVSV